MKTWIYVFEDGYGAYWYNKPMGKRDLAKLEKEHGRLISKEQIR